MNHLFNLKSFFTFLGKNKAYTFIDIFGFSLSLAFVILIATYTSQELSTDHFHENGSRIYAIASHENYGMAFYLGDYLKEKFPEIDKTCAVNSMAKNCLLMIGDQRVSADMTFADPDFFELFSFNLLQGDPGRALSTPGEVIISHSFAKTHFPDVDPIGQRIRISGDFTAIVGGVMEDIKNSVITYCDILAPSVMIRELVPYFYDPGMVAYGNVIVFIQEKPYADLQGKTAEMEVFLKDLFTPYKEGFYNGVQLIPMKDIYFSDIPVHSSILLRKGNRSFVLILLSVGILILIFAIINYINLTVAQTGFRAKEMATRRLLGSERNELFLRLIIESIVMTVISLVVALFLVWLLAPSAGQLLETHLYLKSMVTLLNVFIVLFFVILIGVVAGFLPAVVISDAKPVDVMKGKFRQQTKMVFSKIFIVFQNIITISLVAASLTMLLQINYLLKAPIGYNTDNILTVMTRNMADDQVSALKNEYSSLASVKEIGFSVGLPLVMFDTRIFSYKEKQVGLYYLESDPAFVDMFEIQIIQDNQLATKDGIYLSEQAFRELGIDRSEAVVTLSDISYPIAGVISDLWLRNRNEPAQGVLLRIQEKESFSDRPWCMTLKIEGDHRTVYEQVATRYEEIIGLPFDGKFMDTYLKDSMANQIRTGKIVMLFTFIAIIISLMGLFAMSTYFIRQRSREVAVRKVFGSNNSQILRQLIFVFLGYVLIAFIIATPVMWYIMRDWLTGYHYRITLNPLIFIAAGGFCFLISFITVFIQSYAAANENPVEKIKAE